MIMSIFFTITIIKLHYSDKEMNTMITILPTQLTLIFPLSLFIFYVQFFFLFLIPIAITYFPFLVHSLSFLSAYHCSYKSLLSTVCVDLLRKSMAKPKIHRPHHIHIWRTSSNFGAVNYSGNSGGSLVER